MGDVQSWMKRGEKVLKFDERLTFISEVSLPNLSCQTFFFKEHFAVYRDLAQKAEFHKPPFLCHHFPYY